MLIKPFNKQQAVQMKSKSFLEKLAQCSLEDDNFIHFFVTRASSHVRNGVDNWDAKKFRENSGQADDPIENVAEVSKRGTQLKAETCWLHGP